MGNNSAIPPLLPNMCVCLVCGRTDYKENSERVEDDPCVGSGWICSVCIEESK